MRTAIKVALTVLVAMLSIIVGMPENRTTDTWSTSFQTQAEKIEFMERYLTCPSEVLDAEYHIYYHDNSTGLIPGPSDWEVVAALTVCPTDIPLWTEGMEEIAGEEINMAWWAELQLAAESWTLSGRPVYYRRGDHFVYMVVYEEQGIILKSMSSIMKTE